MIAVTVPSVLPSCNPPKETRSAHAYTDRLWIECAIFADFKNGVVFLLVSSKLITTIIKGLHTWHEFSSEISVTFITFWYSLSEANAC